MIIDSQCHVSPIWYEPAENLLYQMDCNQVQCATLIQMLGQTDNGYQQDCVRRFPGRFTSVVLVDPTRDDACAALRRLADEGASGVRLRPTARSPGADTLAVWRTARDCHLAVSCVGSQATFAAPEFAEVIASFPDLPIVLEHLGGSSRPDADEEEKAKRLAVFELARFQNVYLKVPGLGELAVRKIPPPAARLPFHPPVPPLLERATECFGPLRLMWGSDFPVVSSREGYSNALRWVQSAFLEFPLEAKESIFGGLARRLFGEFSVRQCRYGAQPADPGRADPVRPPRI